MLYWPMTNALYVEGYALDRFAEGLWGLQPVHQNKIGLILDAGIEEDLRARHLQVADATRASLGLPVMEYTITDKPLQVEHWIDPSCGKSTGRVGNPDSLLRAVHNLVNQTDINAVAVIGRFPDDDTEEAEYYRQGKGVDLLAGVEAIISHLVVKEFLIPCAHAPALQAAPLSTLISPKSAAEEVSLVLCNCLCKEFFEPTSRFYWLCAADVDSVILPINAFGGDGALAFARKSRSKTLMIAVEENQTVNDTPEMLGI